VGGFSKPPTTEIRIEVYSSDETVEIVVEAVNDLVTSDRGRFAL